MKQSKEWFINARQLCGDIGPEDGIDPRLAARATGRKAGNHKGRQLGKEARHVLSLIFAGELGDPVFQDLEIIDVTPTDDGQFLTVSLALIDNGIDTSEALILEKCQAVSGYLRSAIASSVKRKRVPALKFELLQ
jgi:ribosome-binding factor A